MAFIQQRRLPNYLSPLWIHGEHGHGKTTLAKVIMGDDTPLILFSQIWPRVAGLCHIEASYQRFILDEVPPKLSVAQVKCLCRMAASGTHEFVVASVHSPKHERLRAHFTLVNIRK